MACAAPAAGNSSRTSQAALRLGSASRAHWRDLSVEAWQAYRALAANWLRWIKATHIVWRSLCYVAQPWLAVPELTRSTGIKINQQG